MKIFVNLITTIRFIYTIILPILQIRISNTAFIINLVILFLTDTIDGFLARKFNVQTFYGSLMDTIADKTLSIVLLIILANHINLLYVVLLCEILIALLNSVEMARRKRTKSLIVGKVKMWFLAITIVCGYLHYFNAITIEVINILCIVTVTLQIVTFVAYIKYLELQKENLREKPTLKTPKDLKYILFDTDFYLNSI